MSKVDKLSVQNSNNVRVQVRIGGDDRVAFCGIAAFPIRNHRPSAANDGDEGHQIPRIHLGVEHDIGLAAGDKIVAEAIAPSPGKVGHAGKLIKVLRSLDLVDISLVRAKQDRFVERFANGSGYGGAIDVSSLSVSADSVADSRVVDAAVDRLATLQESDHRSEKGAARGK